ncbi:MAG: hypothetical protein WCI67_00075 [Chloroflexales bacterium]
MPRLNDVRTRIELEVVVDRAVDCEELQRDLSDILATVQREMEISLCPGESADHEEPEVRGGVRDFVGIADQGVIFIFHLAQLIIVLPQAEIILREYIGRIMSFLRKYNAKITHKEVEPQVRVADLSDSDEEKREEILRLIMKLLSEDEDGDK